MHGRLNRWTSDVKAHPKAGRPPVRVVGALLVLAPLVTGANGAQNDDSRNASNWYQRAFESLKDVPDDVLKPIYRLRGVVFGLLDIVRDDQRGSEANQLPAHTSAC